MSSIIIFLAGVLVGGVVMFFVYRNNKKKFEEVETNLRKKIDILSKNE